MNSKIILKTCVAAVLSLIIGVASADELTNNGMTTPNTSANINVNTGPVPGPAGAAVATSSTTGNVAIKGVAGGGVVGNPGTGYVGKAPGGVAEAVEPGTGFAISGPASNNEAVKETAKGVVVIDKTSQGNKVENLSTGAVKRSP